MSISSSAVAAASAAWVWTPDNATVVEAEEFTILRLPSYFPYQLSVSAFRPAGSVSAAVDAVLEQAREFGVPELQWQVLLDSPHGLAEELSARGGTVQLTLDVLAADLRGGAPELPSPTIDITVRWATDAGTVRDRETVGVGAFGGSLPPEDRIAEIAAQNAAKVPAGEGGTLVAYADGSAVGAGGLDIVDGVARLWGGAVTESARGQGVYRAVLAARLEYAIAHGATMALVKGRIDTSGPILVRAGFAAYGQEPIYRVPL